MGGQLTKQSWVCLVPGIWKAILTKHRSWIPPQAAPGILILPGPIQCPLLPQRSEPLLRHLIVFFLCQLWLAQRQACRVYYLKEKKDSARVTLETRYYKSTQWQG